MTTLSVSVSLSATVTLMCLFLPKLYIILLHPEKNIRQSVTMPQHKYSTQKVPQSSSSSSNKPTIHPDPVSTSSCMAGQNAVLKVTTCIQTNNNSNNNNNSNGNGANQQHQPAKSIRVDSATQSDGKFDALFYFTIHPSIPFLFQPIFNT